MEGFDIGSVTAKVKADLSNFTEGMNQAKEQATGLGEHLSNIAENVRHFAEAASVVVAGQTIAFEELAKRAIEVASNFEQTQTSFGTLLGSEQKAADLMKEIMQFEQHTPFDIGTLTEGAKALLAFGVAQKDIVPHLKEFTDMSQGQAFKLKELISIYGEVNSIQQLNGREVLRLTSIGIPIYEALEEHFKKMGGAAIDAQGNVASLTNVTVNNAKMSASARAGATDRLKEENAQLKILEEEHPKTALAGEKHDLQIMRLKDHIAEATEKLGSHTSSLAGLGGQSKLTGEQIKQMISDGKIGIKDYDEVMHELTSKGGLYFQENIRQMGTFNGIMSSTKSQIEYAILNIMGIDIGAANEVRKGGLFDTIRGLAARLLDFLHQLQPMLTQLGENKNFQLVIEGIVVALGSLALILPIVVIAFNPLILIVFAIEAVIVLLFIAWNKNLFGIRDITQKVITEVMHFFNDYLKPLITEFMIFWSAVWPVVSAILKQYWDVIVAALRIYWDIFYGIIKIGIDLLTGNWKKAWEDMKNTQQNLMNDIINIANVGLNVLKQWGGGILSALVSPFEQAWGKIQDLMNKIRDALDFTKRHSPSVLDIVQNGVQLVNGALEGITYAPNISANQIAGNIITPYNQANISRPSATPSITIQLPNAIISDPAGATRMAELLGNQIVNRLKQNIRF